MGDDAAIAVLAAKVLLAPLCVVAVSAAGRRWGLAVAGILGGLPVVAGPILLVLALVHGASFGAEAAAGTLLGLAGLTSFVVVYALAAERLRPAPCVLLGWAAFLVCVAALSPLDPPPVAALAFVCLCFLGGLRLLDHPDGPVPELGPLPWWDLPTRALAALVLVVGLTAASGALGPQLSGLLAPFPIITSVLAVFTHGHGGPAQVRLLLRSFLVGFFGFATFCFVLATALPSATIAAGFALATAAAVAVQSLVFRARRSTPVALSSGR